MILLVVLVALGSATSAAAQTAAGPAIISRTANDNVTVRAVRVAEPLRIDGRLDEDVYAAVESITGFIQQEPEEGQPATEKTEAWILFDDVNLYICARLAIGTERDRLESHLAAALRQTARLGTLLHIDRRIQNLAHTRP